MAQLFELHPKLGALAQDHDDRATQLHDAFVELQAMIESSAELERTYDEVAAEWRSREDVSPDRYLDVGQKKTQLAYLASYIANGHQNLYSYYALADVWTEYASRFLAIRRLPEIALKIRGVERTGAELLEVVKLLEDQLGELWRQLSIEHDVPLFPTEELIPSRS
ncbi:MAG: hypothetical protein H6509_01125 [Bryobacterales bacterium]|nr:hypothetical protein [Acidobacteriota bacterium]MCB9383187.1 hypothetical protein [Bryobacterales bacterium]